MVVGTNYLKFGEFSEPNSRWRLGSDSSHVYIISWVFYISAENIMGLNGKKIY